MMHHDCRKIRWAIGWRCLAVLVALVIGFSWSRNAQDGPPGITRPVVFPPFNPDAPVCSRPVGLRKALTFAQDNGRKFMQGVARGLELAAKDRGLTYEIDQANNDPGDDDASRCGSSSVRTAARWWFLPSIPIAQPRNQAGDLVRRLCRNGGSATGDFAAECAAIPDRQGARRRGGGLYQDPSQRQGKGGAADA